MLSALFIFVPTDLQEPCSLRSVLAGGLEVPDPLQEMALITNTSLSEQYTSLLASSLDDTLFLFAGTNTGKVHQVHITVYTLIKHLCLFY